MNKRVELIAISKAAKILGLSKAIIMKWIHENNLPYVQFNIEVLLNKKKFIDFLTNRKINPLDHRGKQKQIMDRIGEL